MRLRFTPRALAEMDAILHHIGERSPHGAARQGPTAWPRRFHSEPPYGGRKTSEPRLRRIVAAPYPYVIFYEVKDDEAAIVGVRHGARDPASMPDEGGAT